MARLILLAALLAVTACAAPEPTETDFSAYEAALRAVGKMRSDRRPPDVPFGNDTLSENFRKIAFFESPDDRVAIPHPLSRWEVPVRYDLIGSRMTEDDRAEVKRLMRRAADLTGLPVVRDRAEPNFLIFVLTPAERDRFAQGLGSRYGTATREAFDRLAGFGLDCSVHAFSGDRPNRITAAVVYVRAEVTGFYRTACLHEEIAQGFGLFNDDATVRPSIFNDDEEFALLTEHDELLLKILYDRRLSAGMTADRAMPTVRRIVRDLRPG